MVDYVRYLSGTSFIYVGASRPPIYMGHHVPYLRWVHIPYLRGVHVPYLRGVHVHYLRGVHVPYLRGRITSLIYVGDHVFY